MIDEIDRGLVHALHIDGRAPFARIGTVLGVSAQTVARRYRRLRAEAGLRVVGLASPGHAGQVQWLLRLTSVPHSAQDLARALARRPDTSWVRLASGGTEILAMVRTPSDASDGHALLLHDIPRTAGITSVSAHSVLHVYVGGPTTWGGRTDVLTEEQVGQLRPEKPESAPAGPLPPFGETDRVLLDALAHDGRAGLADLASATGWSPATAARRLAELRSSGALFFDIDLNDSVLGAASQTLLWMSVEPAHLDRVARALAGHGELAFVAATTGPMNLVAQAVCPGPEALHTYLTRRLAPLPGIHTLETTPVLRTLKATGPLTRSPVHPGP